MGRSLKRLPFLDAARLESWSSRVICADCEALPSKTRYAMIREVATRITNECGVVPNPATEGHTELSCSFCGKTQAEVAKLIAGPAVFICNECIGLCVQILREDGMDPEAQK